jgi:hypothetical protein
MPIRIAMWSGPRNISTAMMRAFENRADTAVIDEPFYAAYLAATGLDHPMRADILRSQPQDWRQVVDAITGPVPDGRAIFYQKHMTHHMLPGFGRDWIDDVINVFLLRPPEQVLLSYTAKRADVTLDDIGLPQQVELFERVTERRGTPPLVIEAGDVLADPRGLMTRLCLACGIAFDEAMLTWPAGKRPTDGVWAPAWYDKVEQSTGFAPPRPEAAIGELPNALQRLAALAQPLYQRLQRHKRA